ncbi:MAG: response regulator, partial [Muribaculaceae bacterium]|nr:response regulator [Muribaculaceae bacterium]
MTKLKAVIIDDDLPSIRLLEEELSRRDDIELCATSESLKGGERIIAKHKPDLVFLDMKFPDGSGLA